ncbi:MAG: alpha/beta fold hydrolase [Oscillospiraceae bacterium]|nr:alpha/beta fold hydrolase [Oscillospiraceae bacterium]
MKKTVRIAAAAALALPPLFIEAVTEYCLRMVCLPKRWSAVGMREVEIENGFSDCVEAYEKRWPREDVSFERGGVAIRGEFIDNPADRGACRRIAVICHGQTANRYAALKYADLFLRAGFSVLIYDERYFGESDGDCCTLGQEESLDLAEILSQLRLRFGEDCLIALHGESMGAATALLALRYTSVDLIVADCPFADSEQLFRQWLGNYLPIPPGLILPWFTYAARRRFGYLVGENSPIEAVRGAEVPICFMHGAADTLIDCRHSEELYRACRDGRSELHLFDGADHAQSIVSDRARYERIVLDFLRKCGAAD